MPEEPTPDVKSSFDMQAYTKESSIEKRLDMARDYAERADEAWINAYQGTVRNLSRLHHNTEARIATNIKQVEIESDRAETAGLGNKEEKIQIPAFVDLFQEYQSVAGVAAEIKDGSPDRQDLIEYSQQASKNAWDEFVASLNIDEQTPAIEEAFAYMQEKAEQGQIWVIDPSKESDDDLRKKLIQKSEQIGSYLSLLTISNAGPILIINKPHIRSDMTSYEFLKGIVHERAHDYETQQDSIPLKRGDEASLTVFHEFFAMLEERRFYFKLPPKAKSIMPDYVRSAYEVSAGMKGVYSAKIDNLDTPLKLRLDEGTMALQEAYAHAVNTNIRQGIQLITGAAIKNNADPELVKIAQELARQYSTSPSLVGQELKWKKQSP